MADYFFLPDLYLKKISHSLHLIFLLHIWLSVSHLPMHIDVYILHFSFSHAFQTTSPCTAALHLGQFSICDDDHICRAICISEKLKIIIPKRKTVTYIRSFFLLKTHCKIVLSVSLFLIPLKQLQIILFRLF